MEIFILLPWNLQRIILGYHRPYYFNDIEAVHIHKKMKNYYSKDDYKINNESREIIINDFYILHLLEIFKDDIYDTKIIGDFYTNIKIIKNNWWIIVDYKWLIINRLLVLSKNIIFSFVIKDGTFIIRNIPSSEYVLLFFDIFDDLLINYDVIFYDDKELIKMILCDDMEIILCVNISNPLITYPVLDDE